MKKKQFDERQLRERGKGFRNGFVTAMAVMLAVYTMRELGWSFEPDGQFYLEFWIPVTVALMTFVLGDAIDGINGRGGRVIMSFYAITGIVLTVILIIEHEPLIVGRTITSTAGAWVTAVATVAMGTVYWASSSATAAAKTTTEHRRGTRHAEGLTDRDREPLPLWVYRERAAVHRRGSVSAAVS